MTPRSVAHTTRCDEEVVSMLRRLVVAVALCGALAFAAGGVTASADASTNAKAPPALLNDGGPPVSDGSVGGASIDVGDGANNCLTHLDPMGFSPWTFEGDGLIYDCVGGAAAALKEGWIAIQRYRNGQWQTVGSSAHYGPTAAWPLPMSVTEGCEPGATFEWRVSMVTFLYLGQLYTDHLSSGYEDFPCT
jgi:hypothetical protein